MIWIWSLLATVSAAVTIDDLVGTWTTKSQQVLTGPVCILQHKHKQETDVDRDSTMRSTTD